MTRFFIKWQLPFFIIIFFWGGGIKSPDSPLLKERKKKRAAGFHRFIAGFSESFCCPPPIHLLCTHLRPSAPVEYFSPPEIEADEPRIS